METIPSDHEPLDPEESLLAEIVESLDQAIAEGDTVGDLSSPTVPATILSEARELQDCLAALNEACRAGLIAGRASSISGGASVVAETINFHQRVAAPAGGHDQAAGQMIAHFRIVRELGRGGYGIVYLAVDTLLGRQVALKVPRPEVLVSAEARERFLREAEAAGALHHPNLVPVYEVGSDGPICYIAAAYCAGPTLAAWLNQHGLAEERAAASLIAQLADGVACAHAHAVLHRDIKPRNVLLDTTGTESAGTKEHAPPESLDLYIPRLTDFGLAKLTEKPDEQTKTGTLLGTTVYMAPEQAEGRVRDIETRTDVYGLGAILHELLTGQPPYRGANEADTLRRISLGNLVPPSRLRPGLSHDLEAICTRCLENETARRYASALELAQDLRRFLAGEPTRARPASALERVWKWARRRPAAAALVAVSTIALLVVTAGGWFAYERVRAALAVAEQNARAQQRMSYAQNLRSAWGAWNHDDIEGVHRLLASCEPRPGAEDLREFAWHHLWSLSHQEVRTLNSPATDLYRLAYTPDGKRLISAGKDARIRIWDTATWRLMETLEGHEGEINELAISPSGRWLVTASDDGTARVWDLLASACLHILDGHGRQRVSTVDFAPDEQTLATGGGDGRIVFWDVPRWSERDAIAGHDQRVSHLAYSPLGDVLVSSSADRSLKLWDADSTRLLWQLEQSASVATNAFAISSDGARMVTAAKGECRLWDLDDRKELKTLCATNEWIHGLAFCDDDQSVAITCKDGTVRLIDAGTGQILHRFYSHTRCAWCACPSPDGRQLATGGSLGEIKIWNLDTIGAEESLAAPAPISAVAYTTDGQLVFGGSRSLGLRIRQGARERQLHDVPQVLTVTGDFDGDGLRDQGTFQAGQWRLEMTGEPNPALQSIQFGGPADVPIVGDWDGDGRDELGTFREGLWQFDFDLTGGSAEQSAEYGVKTDQPVVGDWNGDGKDDLGVYKLGLFDLCYGLTGGPANITLVLGRKDSIPMAGDWDGNGSDEVAVLDDNELLIDLGLSGQPAEYRVELPASGARYIAQAVANAGELDSTFGTAGVATALLPVQSESVKVHVQPDGRLIAATAKILSAEQGAIGALVRFQADGQVDASFGPDHTGMVELPREESTGITALIRQADGKLVVLSEGMREGRGICSLTRFSSDGALDTTFGAHGQARVVYGPGVCRAKGLALQADGKIVVAGWHEPEGSKFADSALARFTADGLLDASFGPDASGYIILPTSPFADFATCLVIQNDGRIVVGGYAWDEAICSAAVVRLHGDGSLDTSFGAGGKLVARPPSTHTNVFGMALLPSGKIVVSGVAARASSDAMLARIEPSGRLDSSFGSLGWVIAPFGPGFGALTQLAIDRAGRIVAVGQSNSGQGPRLAMFRFRSDGGLETDFTATLGEHPVLSRGLSQGWDVAADQEGRPVVAGVAVGAQGHDAILARFREEPSNAAPTVEVHKSWRNWPDVERMNNMLTPALLASAIDRNEAKQQRRIISLAVSPTSDFAATCREDDGRISVWDLRREKMICQLDAHNVEARAVAFSPLGNVLASVGRDGILKLWETASWQLSATINDPPSPYHAVAFSPAGKVLVTGSNTGVLLRSADKLSVMHELDHPDVTALAFSPDGQVLATGGHDGLIKVWDVATGAIKAALTGHTGPVNSLSFLSNGRTLASCAPYDGVRLWDMLTFQELAVMPNPTGSLAAIACNSEGRQLAVAGEVPDDRGELRIFSTAGSAAQSGAH